MSPDRFAMYLKLALSKTFVSRTQKVKIKQETLLFLNIKINLIFKLNYVNNLLLLR